MTVSRTLIGLIKDEPIREYTVLDVGCGDGALSFRISVAAGKVVGVDISEDAVRRAQRKAAANTFFYVGDAEKLDYSSFGEIDMVVSNLCMSEQIIKKSYDVLSRGGVLAFACFHERHLIEGGRRSRFSFSKPEMRELLVNAGFAIEYIEIEDETVGFESLADALNLLGEKTVERWKDDGRLEHFKSYIREGGRSFTRSILVVKARK